MRHHAWSVQQSALVVTMSWAVLGFIVSLMTERKSIHNFRERKDFEKLLERSSLAHKNLYAHCTKCGEETARDPDDKRKCVVGHWLPKENR